MMLMLSPFQTASTFKQDPQDPIRIRVQVDTEIIKIRCPCWTH